MLSEETQHQSQLRVIWPLPGIVEQQFTLKAMPEGRMERSGEDERG